MNARRQKIRVPRGMLASINEAREAKLPEDLDESSLHVLRCAFLLTGGVVGDSVSKGVLGRFAEIVTPEESERFIQRAREKGYLK